MDINTEKRVRSATILMWDLSLSEVSQNVTLEARPKRGVGINNASREGGADDIAGTTAVKALR